jgi:putative addiction module component (TIGR02574 family)
LDGPEPTPAQQAEVDAAWAKEIERRTREVDAGRMELIPAEQVFAEVEEVIRKVRAARKKRKV